MMYSIRKFRESDAERLANWWRHILTNYWNQSAFAYKRENQKEHVLAGLSAESLIAKERHPTAICTYLLESGPNLLGTVRLSKALEQEGVLILSELQVRPAYHRRGLGKALVLKCVDQAIQLNSRRLDLKTWAFNRKGIPLYKKAGFFWLPRTSVDMQNYIPSIFRMPEAKAFFEKHDWYKTFQREITFQYDVYKEEGRLIFPYIWEEGDDRLKVLVDWKNERIISFEVRQAGLILKGRKKVDFSAHTGKGVKIAVVDSGIDPTHPDVRVVKGGVAIHRSNTGEIIFDSDYRDEIGHGTACAGIIRNKARNIELYAVKVLDNNLSTDAKRLTEAIKWAADNGMNVANLSLGTTDRDNIRLLQEACDYALKKNVVIVAAEHNAGLESYPAVFPNVIGVTGGKVYDKYSYFYRPDYPIEFVARGDRQRLAWVNPRYLFIGGTSFAAPHITAIVALILERYPEAGFEEIKEILIANASEGEPELVRGEELYHPLEIRREARKSVPPTRGRKYSWIKKAALYPYNKEMHAFIRYRDLLEFEIAGVADPVGKGLVGKDAGEAIGIEPVGIQIQHSLQRAMGEADTLILGYVDQLGRITKRDLLGEIADKAIQLGKHLFSFVPLSEEKYPELFQSAREKGVRIAYPTLEDLDDTWSYSKEQDVDVPVVGVFGTSSQQGKFTVQLALRRKLRQKGYKVGQIGTEPHSELFGFDLAFPNGYASIVHWPERQHIWYLHGKMVELCQQMPPDIIIVGAQSGIIPYDLSSYRSYTLPSIAFLFGTKPDAYILTVNSIDPEEYIQDSINALKALGKGKTILLTMSDKEKDIRSAYGTSRVVPRQMSPEEIKVKLAHLEDRFGILATEVVSEEGQEKLAITVTDYFAEES